MRGRHSSNSPISPASRRCRSGYAPQTVPADLCRAGVAATDRSIGSHGRYVSFQMAEVAVRRQMSRQILMLIAWLRAPPAPALRGFVVAAQTTIEEVGVDEGKSLGSRPAARQADPWLSLLRAAIAGEPCCHGGPRYSKSPHNLGNLGNVGAKCHVWTTPSKQGRFGMCAAVGCGHVSGLRCAALGPLSPLHRRSGTLSHPPYLAGNVCAG